MNTERNHDRNKQNDLSTSQAPSSIASVTSGPSKFSKAIVSDPIHQEGIFRFSVTSQRRLT